jgi:endonuclease/exonuclease/phosphatase (EEP) superfamily protein YafD
VPRGGEQAKLIDLIVWVIVALIGLVALTQATGWTGAAPVAVVQALTPYLALALVPAVLIALWRQRPLIVTVALAVGAGLGVLAGPLAFPDPQPLAAPNSVGLRVGALNLWYQNTDITAVADLLESVDVDVLVFIEFTQAHRAALEASPLARAYPYQTNQTGSGPTEMGVWSRFPFDQRRELPTFNSSFDLDVQGPDGDVRVVTMHLPTPIKDFDAWQDDLAIAAQIGRTTNGPTLLIGDLNASYWHPDFRRVLDTGFVDAHTADGSGFSASWPTDRWWLPPFVRLDHALTTGSLMSSDVVDIDTPGSDHLGLVVTVVPTR